MENLSSSTNPTPRTDDQPPSHKPGITPVQKPLDLDQKPEPEQDGEDDEDASGNK